MKNDFVSDAGVKVERWQGPSLCVVLSDQFVYSVMKTKTVSLLEIY